MRESVIFACLTCCAAIWSPPETIAVRGVSGAMEMFQGSPQVKNAPSPDVATLRFDNDLKSFVLKNHGKEPIGIYASNSKSPFTKVERLTRDGWVGTWTDFGCGTGARWLSLEPGESLTFIGHVETALSYLRPNGDLDVKYPDLDRLPFHVGIHISKGESGKVTTIWSEKVVPRSR